MSTMRAESRPRLPRFQRTSPFNRKAVVKKFCLYPGDVEKLRKLCRGKERQESLIIRWLLRNAPKRIPEMELFQVMREDDLLRGLSKSLSPDPRVVELERGE